MLGFHRFQIFLQEFILFINAGRMFVHFPMGRFAVRDIHLGHLATTCNIVSHNEGSGTGWASGSRFVVVVRI